VVENGIPKTTALKMGRELVSIKAKTPFEIKSPQATIEDP